MELSKAVHYLYGQINQLFKWKAEMALFVFCFYLSVRRTKVNRDICYSYPVGQLGRSKFTKFILK